MCTFSAFPPSSFCSCCPPLTLPILPTQLLLFTPSTLNLPSAPPLFSVWSSKKLDEPKRMQTPSQAQHPHNSSLWALQQSTQTPKESLFVGTWLIWHVAPWWFWLSWIEVRLLEQDLGDWGCKEHQGHLADVLDDCFHDIISCVQQKAVSAPQAVLVESELSNSTLLCWRSVCASCKKSG